MAEPNLKKLILFTAPSGAGKTTIVRELLKSFNNLAFSISVTTREKRSYEVDGKDYYFLSKLDFDKKVENNEFLEWEEVYEGVYYGTLKSEINRIWGTNKAVIFDVDVKGALKIKEFHGHNCLSIFVKPPSLFTLFERLNNRKTESEESLAYRIAKAEKELNYEKKFDTVVINDILEDAIINAKEIVNKFLE